MDTAWPTAADDADKRLLPATPTKAVDTLAVLALAIADNRQGTKRE